MASGRKVVTRRHSGTRAAGQRFGFQFDWHHFDWSCETYVKTGKMMPDDGIEQLKRFDAIFLGAVDIRGFRTTSRSGAFSFPSAAISGST